MTLTRPFATSHLIRAMRSHAPELAEALRQAWLEKEIGFEGVVALISGYDKLDGENKMNVLIGDLTVSQWLGVEAEHEDEGKMKETEKETKKYTKRELTRSRDIGALGLSDEQIREFGFTQEGPDEYSYGV